MQISLCTIAFRHAPHHLAFQAIVDELRSAGFDALEVWGQHLDHEGLPAIQAALAGPGWPVPMISPYFDFTAGPQAWQASLETAERFIGYSAALGRPLVRAFTGHVASAEATPAHWATCVAGLQQVCDLGQVQGVSFALEPHPGQLSDTWPSVLKLLELVARPNLKVNYQPGVFALDKELEAIARLTPYIAHVHYINNAPLAQRTSPGYAQAALPDWPRLLSALAESGYQGYISIEHPPEPVNVWAIVEVAYLRGVLAGL